MTKARGRYAPSPTGELHLGNASSALLAWLSIRAVCGTFVMRVEDLDRHRVRPELVAPILRDLGWLGLDWDEGPDRGGPHPPYEQWQRRESHGSALARLQEAGKVYPCFCSRRDIAAAASAPQSPGDELRYPGTCRNLAPLEAQARLDKGARHAWRFRVEPDANPEFVDRVHGPHRAAEPPGDFVVYRADGVPAYQLAVVVDDAAMAVNEVVRGDDLLASTLRQILLYRALDLPTPTFGHVPLLHGPDRVRLSKRHAGISIRALREAGFRAEELVGRLAWLHGLRSDPGPVRATELVDGFRLGRVRPRPEGIVVDPRSWGRGRLPRPGKDPDNPR